MDGGGKITKNPTTINQSWENSQTFKQLIKVCTVQLLSKTSSGISSPAASLKVLLSAELITVLQYYPVMSGPAREDELDQNDQISYTCRIGM